MAFCLRHIYDQVLTLLPTKPLDGMDEGHVKVRRPPESRQLGPVVLPHRWNPLLAAPLRLAAFLVVSLLALRVVVGAAIVA